MSTGLTVSKAFRILPPIVATVLVSLPHASSAAGADDNAAENRRQSSTRQIHAGGRDGSLSGARQDEYDALRIDGVRERTSLVSDEKPGEGSSVSRAVDNDFWFYSADVELFNDDDGDGYYHGIDLLFDADTYYEEADVYAVAFLSFEGGPWNEYAATDTFTLFGATSDDEFVIVSELNSGYPTGDYDLLIELYDAIDGAFLASFGPQDTSELAFLPVEDFDRDAPYDREISGGGGGGAGVVWIATLLLLLAIRGVRSRRLRDRARRCGPFS